MAVKIGWCVAEPRFSDMLQEPPELMRVDIRCPVIAAWAAQTYAIRAPFDLDIEFKVSGEGAAIAWRTDYDFMIDPHTIVPFTNPSQWRAPTLPSVQWLINNLFVADETVYVETCAPFFHYRDEALPGVMMPTRFNIRSWTRPLQWVFEWHDRSQPLQIKRGDPIQYVRFHTKNMNETFKIQRLEYSEALEAAVKRCRGLGPFRRNLHEVGDALLGRRPKRFLS